MTTETLEAYRRHLRAQGYAATTLKLKLQAVRCFTAAAGIDDPRELTVEHVVDYLGSRELAAWTRLKYLEHLRDFAAWAGIADPTDGVRMPKQPRGIPRPISEQALATLLGAATGRTRAFIILGAYAGLRSFETAKVRGDDLQQTAGGPLLRVEGKGGHVDVVPAAFVIVRELATWRAAAGSGALWPGCTPIAVQCAIRKLGQDVGVDVTSHQLRHRFGTAVYAASKDLLLTQQLMRHAHPTTTAGYAQVNDDAAARLVDLLPVPGDPGLSAVG